MKKLIAAVAATLLTSTAFAAPTLVNGSFETNAVGNGYAYGSLAGASGWTIGDTAALSHNHTDWGGATSSGNYFAVLQNISSISQTFTSDASAVYSISFDMAKRPFGDDGQVVGVMLDGHDLGSYDSTSTSWTSWGTFATASVTLGAGEHTLTFSGLNPDHKGDTSAYVDNIHLNVSAVPEPATYGMLMAGLGLVGLVARRRKA